MISIQEKMRRRAQERYDKAILTLKPAEDKSYDMDEVAERIADQVLVDVRAMQLRQAKQDLMLLRREEEDEDGAGGLQLNLFGEGRLVDYDPLRLVLGQDTPCIGAAAAHQARYHRHTQTWGLLEPRKCCVACGAQAPVEAA